MLIDELFIMFNVKLLKNWKRCYEQETFWNIFQPVKQRALC